MMEAARQSHRLTWSEVDIGHILGLQDMRTPQKTAFHHKSIHILNQLLILTTSLCLLFGSSSN